MTQETSYGAKILKALGKLGSNGTENPDDKHNTGRVLGKIYLWNQVKKVAEGKLEAAWVEAVTSGIIEGRVTKDGVKLDLEPGDHELASSPSFVITAKASEPVKRFNAGALAAALKAKYKVPEPIALEMIAQAKVPTSSTITKSIIEKQP